MTRWQHTYVLIDPSDDPCTEINKLGAEGWEAFAVTEENKDNHGVIYLKRPMPEPEPAQMKIGGWHLCDHCRGVVYNGQSCTHCGTGAKF